MLSVYPVTAIGSEAFKDYQTMTSVTIPDSITTIGYKAFTGCIALVNITIPDSVTAIDRWAFGDCASLTSITIPDGITTLSASVFGGCNSLSNVTIPVSVTAVDAGAFFSCRSFTTVNYAGTEEQWLAININNQNGDNSSLLNANIYCNYHEHSYTAVVTAPGCTEAGYTTYTCSQCGDSYVADETAPLGHSFANGFCTVCGASDPNYVEPTPDPDAPKLVVSDARARAGEQLTVTVSIENNPGVAGLDMRLVYDANVLTLNNIASGGLFSGFSTGRNIILDEDGDVTEDSVIMTLTFTVADDAEEGSYMVGVIVREATNYDLDDVELAVVSGKVNVVDFIYGDANNDGAISIKDVVLLRRFLSNYDDVTGTSTVEIGLGADANGDGTISIKDVVILRRYLSSYDEGSGTADVVLGPQN